MRLERCIADVLGHDCGYIDESATGHLSSHQRGRISLPRVQEGMLSRSELPPESARVFFEGLCRTPDAHLGL